MVIAAGISHRTFVSTLSESALLMQAAVARLEQELWRVRISETQIREVCEREVQEAARLRQTLLESESKILSLEERIEEAEEEMRKVDKELASRSEERDQEHEAVRAAQSDVDRLNKELAEVNAIIRNLQKEVETSREQIAACGQEKDALSADMETLRRALDEEKQMREGAEERERHWEKISGELSGQVCMNACMCL